MVNVGKAMNDQSLFLQWQCEYCATIVHNITFFTSQLVLVHPYPPKPVIKNVPISLALLLIAPILYTKIRPHDGTSPTRARCIVVSVKRSRFTTPVYNLPLLPHRSLSTPPLCHCTAKQLKQSHFDVSLVNLAASHRPFLSPDLCGRFVCTHIREQVIHGEFKIIYSKTI